MLSLEKQYWQAMKNRDVAAALQLTDFPCIIAGPHGVRRVDRASFEKIMNAAPYTIDSVSVDDAEVRMITDDTAVVAYNLHERLTVEGKPVTIEAADASTWVRRNGRWACALHTESLLGDPYGRGRPAHA